MSWFSNIPEYAVSLGAACFLGNKVGRRINIIEKWDDMDMDLVPMLGHLTIAAVAAIGGALVLGSSVYEFSKLGPWGADGGLGILTALAYLSSFAFGSHQAAQQ